MMLYIDTTEFGKLAFKLENRQKEFKKIYQLTPQHSGKILERLAAFLSASKIRLGRSSLISGGKAENSTVQLSLEWGSQIRKIIICKKQSSSFTGLRIAVAIAQALSLAWRVPVKITERNCTGIIRGGVALRRGTAGAD